MQELLDAIIAIVSGKVEASDQEAARPLLAELETLLAAVDDDTVDDIVATLKVVIKAATSGEKPLPTQPATTPAVPVIATVPADPRVFASIPDDEAPAAPHRPVGKGPAPATTDNGAQSDIAASAGRSDPVAQAAVVRFAVELGVKVEGKSPTLAAPKSGDESFTAAPRAALVAVLPVPSGEQPTAAPDSTGPTQAIFGVQADGGEPAPAIPTSDLKFEVVNPTPTTPAATVEITTGAGQVQSADTAVNAVSAVAHPVDEVPAIPVTAPAVTVSGMSDTALVARPLATAGEPDVAVQIVRHARITIAEGGGKASMQLQPPELGRLDLEITVAKGGIVSMHVISHSQEARSLVQSQFAELQASLQDQGLEVGDITVSVRDQRESSERQADGGPGEGSEGPAESDSLDLIINPPGVPQLAFAGYGTLDFSA